MLFINSKCKLGDGPLIYKNREQEIEIWKHTVDFYLNS